MTGQARPGRPGRLIRNGWNEKSIGLIKRKRLPSPSFLLVKFISFLGEKKQRTHFPLIDFTGFLQLDSRMFIPFAFRADTQDSVVIKSSSAGFPGIF